MVVNMTQTNASQHGQGLGSMVSLLQGHLAGCGLRAQLKPADMTGDG